MKKKYHIDYGNSDKKEVEVGSLQQAKELAVKGMSYTQKNVRIFDDGEVVAVSHWYDGTPIGLEEILVTFGDLGFYAEWVEDEIPKVYGLKEFAEFIGMEKGGLGTKLKRQRDGKGVKHKLPMPIQILGATPLWTEEQVVRYKEEMSKEQQ